MARPRKPLELRAIEGDTRKIGAKKLEQLVASGPKTMRGLPKAGADWSAAQQRAYEAISAELEIMGCDKTADAFSVEFAAFWLADFWQLRQEFNLCDDQLQRAEVRREMVKASKEWMAFASKYGLTADSRARLAMGTSERQKIDLMSVLMADDSGTEAVQ